MTVEYLAVVRTRVFSSDKMLVCYMAPANNYDCLETFLSSCYVAGKIPEEMFFAVLGPVRIPSSTDELLIDAEEAAVLLYKTEGFSFMTTTKLTDHEIELYKRSSVVIPLSFINHMPKEVISGIYSIIPDKVELDFSLS